MSGAELIDGVVKIMGVITPFALWWLARKQTRYHKAVNGKMDELLDTTKALGVAEGKAEEKSKP